MRLTRSISTVDAHTAGEPLRVITSGYPQIPGETIMDKRSYVSENLDHLRKFLMLEPRGHSGMYGCLITPAVTDDGDFGVIFMHNEGYSAMCGHGIIAVTKVAVATGMIAAEDNEKKKVKIDSPAGRVTAFAQIRDGEVIGTSFENVPSFVYEKDIDVPVEGLGKVKVSIAFGGAFYAFVDAEDHDISTDRENVDELVDLGMRIKYAVMDQMKVTHKENERLGGIYGTIFTDRLRMCGEKVISKNVTIFADGQIDRSPTGTGTSARLALMHDEGTISSGQILHNASVIDTEFTGYVRKEVSVGNSVGIIPVVSGDAYISGFNQWVLEKEDPLPEGFYLTGG